MPNKRDEFEGSIDMREFAHLDKYEVPIEFKPKEIEPVKMPLLSKNVKHLDKLIEARVLWNEEIKEEKPCIEIIDTNGNHFPLATFGNISVITGQAKSRKSFFVTAIAGAFCNPTKKALDMIQGAQIESKRVVLYFDTEQARFHVKTVLNRIIEISGHTPEKLEFLNVFSLRKYPPGERFNIIKTAIDNTENLGLVVIDGIRDLITNINDPDQATQITTDLLKWSEEKDCHILTVIHENKGNEQARGHIGTELINKAETVISIRKEQENSTRSEVVPTYTRGKAFENFAFKISEYGMPILDTDYQPENKGRTPKLKVNDLNRIQIDGILHIAFKQSAELSYNELFERLQFACYEYMNASLGTNKVKELITFFKSKEVITKIDPENKNSKYKRS
jgi:RecA-family ATPase